MRSCRHFKTNRCYHLISRVAHKAFFLDACRYNVDRGGTFTLGMSNGECTARDSEMNIVESGFSWQVDGPCSGVRHFTAHRPGCSSSPSGTLFTVEFEPEDAGAPVSGSANIAFVEWDTQTVETWPSNRHRKELGVGEEVDVVFTPALAFSAAAITDPSGSVICNGMGKYRYTAPMNKCADTIRFAADLGCVCSIPFSILEPTGNIVINVSSNVENSLNVAGTFEIYFDLALAPTNVSFRDRIEIAEIGMASVNAIGYFTNPSLSGLLDHGLHGANNWVDVRDHNYTGIDTVGPGALYPPFGDGSLTWPIPNHWRMKGDAGNGKTFSNDDQHFAITTSGATSVWKFGKKGRRDLNSSILTITNEAIPCEQQ